MGVSPGDGLRLCIGSALAWKTAAKVMTVWSQWRQPPPGATPLASRKAHLVLRLPTPHLLSTPTPPPEDPVRGANPHTPLIPSPSALLAPSGQGALCHCRSHYSKSLRASTNSGPSLEKQSDNLCVLLHSSRTAREPVSHKVDLPSHPLAHQMITST